ncbi:hypothetical protein TYRP_002005 [Tyrophagus putrescentiae]|nr:hypothetical protein TYRP_002005 [Tyrophagus putrescentiae]
MSTLLTTSANGSLTSDNKTRNNTFATEAGSVIVAAIVYPMLAILIVIVTVACIYVWTCGPKAVMNETSTRRSNAASSKTKKSEVHHFKGVTGK